MSILCVGSTKGGVGKTTLAVNFTVALAQCGQDVLLIDGDDQGHAQAFTEIRAAARPDQGPGYTAVTLLGQQIRTQVRQQRDRYDQIVIDVGGRDTASLRNALLVSDLIVVPTQPRSADLWGAEATVELIAQARDLNENLKALVVLNLADATGNDNNASESALEDLEGLQVSETRIGRRKALPNAFAAGLGIFEYQERSPSTAKAQAEFAELFTSIYPKLKLERKIA